MHRGSFVNDADLGFHRDGDTTYHPPYAINNGNSRQPLAAKTISPTAKHFGGARHYDAHNLFSLGEARATHDALADITGQRPFVLSRCGQV